MRVLHLGLEKSWRGGENQVYLLIQGLKSMGVDNYVAYPKSSKGYSKFQDVAEVLGLPSSKSYDLRSVLQIVKLCKKKSIDIIDAHSSGAHSLGLMVKKFLPNIKLVVHRRVDNKIKNRRSTKIKYLSPHVDKFVCISDCIKNMVIEYGVDANKVVAVKSAIDGEKYLNFDASAEKQKWCEYLNVPSDIPLIGNASAFTDQKGIDVLLKAMAILKSRGHNFYCALAGDGILLPSMKQLAQDLKINDCVSFLGFIDNVPSFLSALDILAMPSNNEGLGTLILDAISAGCVVAATEVGGIPEMIVHEQTGMLSQVGDAKELADNIEKILTTPKLPQTLKEQSQKKIKEQFSLQSMVTGNFNIYQSLMSARHK